MIIKTKLPTSHSLVERLSITCKRGSAFIYRVGLVFLAFFLLATVLHAQTSINWSSSQANLGIGDYARMCHLANGDWLAFYTTNQAYGVNYLNIYKSTDTCRTWTQISTINEEPSRELGNGHMLQLTNGNLLFVARSDVLDFSAGWATNYALHVYQSLNNGTNWSYLSTVDSLAIPGSHQGLWEPVINYGSDGRLVCLYSDESEQPTYSQVISERVSSDSGVTWGTKTTAAADLYNSSDRPGMAEVARMANGNYIMVFELTCCGAAYKTSSDGENWPAGDGTVIPDQHTAPFVLAWPDGRVFVTSGGGNTKVSSDYGTSWQAVSSPWYISNTYPAIYQTKPNEIAWIMGLKSPYSPTVSVQYGTVSPAPVDLTTSRKTELTLMDGRKMVFACAYPDGSIWNQWENTPGGSWSGWNEFTNTVGFRRLDALQNPDGTLVLFGVGDGSSVWLNWQTVSNGSWNANFTNLGGTLNDIKAFRYPISVGGRYVVFGVDGSSTWAMSQTTDNSSPGANWGTWQQFTGSGFTQISPVLLPNNAFVMMGIGNMTQAWLNYQTGYQQSWSGWQAMGGGFNNVRLFRDNDGRLTLFAGDGDAVWNITQTTNVDFYHWGVWQQLPGHEISQFDPVQLSNGCFSILATGGGGSIYQNTQLTPGGTWTGLTNLGGAGFDQVHADQQKDGRLYYFANALDSSEWFRYQAVSNGVWNVGWTNLGGYIY